MVFYIVAIFTLFLLLFRFVPALRINGLPKWTMPLAFTLKVLMGLYFLFIYSVYYGDGELSADAGKFMKESKMLQDVFFQSKSAYFKLLFGIGNHPELIQQYLVETSHWDPGTQAVISDNRNILRVHSVIHFFSFNRPSIHMIIMCFFSLIGIKQLFLAIQRYSQWKDLILFTVLLLIPSLLFWSSSILKEPLMILGFGLFLRAVLADDPLRKKWLFAGIGFFLMVSFKSYIIIALIPVMLFYVLYRLLPKWKTGGSITILVALIGLVVMLFRQEREDLVQRLSRKQYDFISVAKGGIHAYADSLFYYFEADQFQYLTIENDSVRVDKDLTAETLHLGDVSNPGTIELKASDKKWRIYFMNQRCDGYIPITPINNSFLQLIINIPQALANTLFRPYPWNEGKWLKYPAMIEICIMWILLILAFIKRRKTDAKEKKIIAASLIFIFTLSLIIGWVTPVLGAIVRYRIPVLIAFFLIIAIIYKPPLKFSKHEQE